MWFNRSSNLQKFNKSIPSNKTDYVFYYTNWIALLMIFLWAVLWHHWFIVIWKWYQFLRDIDIVSKNLYIRYTVILISIFEDEQNLISFHAESDSSLYELYQYTDFFDFSSDLIFRDSGYIIFLFCSIESDVQLA